MRTKTLLTALAALAAGIITSNAQVYSANVVGYASLATASANVNYLIAVPFKIGVSNGLNEVFSTPLPDSSSILIWNGSGYNTYVSDSGSPSGWDDANFNSLSAVPTVPVGQGFFLNPSASGVTNTFAGVIAVN